MPCHLAVTSAAYVCGPRPTVTRRPWRGFAACAAHPSATRPGTSASLRRPFRGRPISIVSGSKGASQPPAPIAAAPAQLRARGDGTASVRVALGQVWRTSTWWHTSMLCGIGGATARCTRCACRSSASCGCARQSLARAGCRRARESARGVRRVSLSPVFARPQLVGACPAAAGWVERLKNSPLLETSFGAVTLSRVDIVQTVPARVVTYHAREGRSVQESSP